MRFVGETLARGLIEVVSADENYGDARNLYSSVIRIGVSWSTDDLCHALAGACGPRYSNRVKMDCIGFPVSLG